MPIALIAHYVGPQLGIGQYLDRLLPPLVNQLRAAGVSLKILGSPNAVKKTQALSALQECVQVLPSLDYSPAKRFLWFFSSFRNYCKSQNINQVIWLSNPIVLPWHPPSISVLHDVNEWKTHNQGRLQTTLRSIIYLEFSIRFSQKIILISKAVKQDFLSHRSEKKLQDKLTTISNGFDSALVTLEPCQISISHQPFLLSVGRIDPKSKRLSEAVEFTSALREISQEPWELHLVGGMNDSTKALGESFLDSVKDISWVHYHGYVNNQELAQWYRMAEAVIFLSDNEGFGLPVAEAASFGKHVIVSQYNRVALEAGSISVISVNPEEPRHSVAQVWHQLQQKKSFSVDLPTWEDAAIAYSDLIIDECRNA